MNEITTVIFDMDGVLIDARDWHYEALNKALKLFGLSISRYDHLVTFDGLPTKKKLELLSREQNLPFELHSFVNELKQRNTIEIVHARCKPRFQHEYALSRLRSEGYKLAVASNSVRCTIDLMMEKSALASYLDLTLSNQDVQHAKPHPEIYLKVMEALNVRPEEVLVVEDSEYGINAARTSGAHVMVVRDPNEVTWDRINQRIETAQIQ